MRFGILAILFLALRLLVPNAGAAGVGDREGPVHKRVLILYAERSELPAIRAIDGGLRDSFAARGGVEIFTEYLDFSRFPAATHADGLTTLLSDRYGRDKLDLVIAAGYQALEFAVSRREVLFPGVPITYCGLEQHQLDGKALPEDVTGAVLYYDFRRTVQLALKLQPDLREVMCVFGTSDFDLQTGADALAALSEYPQLEVHRLDPLPFAEIIERVRKAPDRSMVLFVTLMRDSAGQTHFPTAVAGEISTASRVPVYGVAAHHLEKGLIGGAMADYTQHAREAGKVAVARLDGQQVRPGKLTSPPYLLNWGALKKWNLPPDRIPREAVVRFRPPTLWEEHRGAIIALISVVLTQSALITLLLVNRGSRLRTERELAETTERMSLAADAANLGMWVWDVAGDDAWMTERGRALFGIQPDAPIDYAAILDRVHPEDRDVRDAALKQALENQGKYEMEYRVQSPDGGVRWISARGRCVATSPGKGKKLLGVSMDVTARKQRELEAMVHREELTHLSRVALAGEMATSLAHELNQPLTAIVTNASAAQRFLARGEMDPEDLSELLADIAADGLRAGEVIRSIKGMVRKVGGQCQPLEINSVIGDVMRIVRADALARGFTVAADLDPDLPPVNGDAVQLQQVFLNLIINAFDSMRKTPEDSRRVEIVSRFGDTEVVETSVRDYGAGLPDGAPTRVFDRFFSTKGDGMGMGLAIVRSIIEAHGGTLGAENAEGGGARFWFRIPATDKPIVKEQT